MKETSNLISSIQTSKSSFHFQAVPMLTKEILKIQQKFEKFFLLKLKPSKNRLLTSLSSRLCCLIHSERRATTEHVSEKDFQINLDVGEILNQKKKKKLARFTCPFITFLSL